MKLAIPLYILLQVAGISTFAQTELQLSEIMAGNEFIGPQPDNINWSPNSKAFYFSWDHDNDKKASYFIYTLKDKSYRKLTDKETKKRPIDGFIKNESGESVYFKNSNNVLYKWHEKQSDPIFSFHNSFKVEKVFDSGSLLIRIENEFYKYNPNTPSFIRLFGFKDVDKSDDSNSFLENQQKELFEHFDETKPKNEKVPWDEIPKGKGNVVSWVALNKAENAILFESSNYSNKAETYYMSYLTESGHAKSIKARAKVGENSPNHWLYIHDSMRDTTILIDISSLEGVKKQAEYLQKYDKQASVELDNPKDVIYHSHGTNPSGNKFLIEIKSYDNKDRWIAVTDLKGELVEIDHQHDTAWIGGPGISGWNMVSGNCGWIDDNTVYYQSEKTAYSHLYSHNIKSKKTKTLTSGQFEIHDAVLSDNKDRFFITANKSHPGNREFYILNIENGELTPILNQDGYHEVIPSPNEKHLAIRYSYINKPWELYYAECKEGVSPDQITTSTTKRFKAYKWKKPEVITFKASDGKNIYARLYQPENKLKNNAGVIFVHGAGYLQNAHNWWSGYYREYMFNNLLADQGYTVLDIDYRASKGYGRDVRTAIYRHMGGKDLSDQLDGRSYLINELGIDSNRIGIYGGSYGGFITLMALLTEPGKFKCGAALRSVADWAHYNHPYTSNILNTPKTDPEAFKKSSPIYFAENLEDHLLMLHGIEDDNVQYQDVVRLSQRFIELRKKNWNLIGYPVEAHSFKETTSWTDEYRRILELFEQHLTLSR